MSYFYKKALVLGLFFMFSSAQAECVTAYEDGRWVQHFWEFEKTGREIKTTHEDFLENEEKLWWCGHGALKIVLKHRTGVQHSLRKIHNTFLKYGGNYSRNNCNYNASNARYCAYIDDMVPVARRYFGLPGATMEYIPNDKQGPSLHSKRKMFNVIRDAITKKKLLIGFGTLSTDPNNLGNIGHAWVIIGYNTNSVPNPDYDPSNVWVFLRDTNEKNPIYPEMDRWVTIDTLYKMMAKNTNNQLKVGVF